MPGLPFQLASLFVRPNREGSEKSLKDSISRGLVFADDTNVFVSHNDKDCLTNILNAELKKVLLWFRANRLSLNLKKKNKFIVFKPCQKRTNQTIQLLINGQKID